MNKAQTSETQKRKKRGIIAGLAGLFLNLLLGGTKLAAGLISGSASILGDAANNISDSGASIVTVSSFLLSGKKADKEHPFGHGRYEYISGLVIGILILFVGFEFILTGIDRIVSPKEIEAGTLIFIILSVSIAAKLFMAIFYGLAARNINSDALKASMLDSIFDTLTTTVVLLSVSLNSVLPFRIDGYCTVFVAVVIIYGGIKVITDGLGKLLGKAATPELIENVYKTVLHHPLICGAHDLEIHDYGPGRKLGTVHAEFDKDLSITEAHKIIDGIEKAAKTEFGLELVIHVDPIDFSNPELNALRIQIKDILSRYNKVSMHELNLDSEALHISFDIKTPHENERLKEDISANIRESLSDKFPGYSLNINFDIY